MVCASARWTTSSTSAPARCGWRPCWCHFPDPDLLPLEFDDTFVAALKAELPELPDEKRERFQSDFGLSAYDTDILVSDRAIADYFEAVAGGRDAKQVANWVINDLLGHLNKAGETIETTPVSSAQLR